MNFFPLKNHLLQHQTGWKIWYYPFLFLAVVLPSFIVMGVETFFPLGKSSSFIQMILMPVLAILILWLFKLKRPTKRDLGLDKGIDRKALVIILIVFAVSHLIFYLLGKFGGMKSDPVALFNEYGFKDGLSGSLIAVISTTILAPVCEEILYRGAMLRSVHDGSLKIFPKKNASLFSIPVILSVVAVALAFIMPHISDFTQTELVFAYFISSAGFSLVYILTGSLTAAMVSHALQSCVAFGTVLLFGKGDADVHPLIYIITFGCPLIVYGIGTLIRKL